MRGIPHCCQTCSFLQHGIRKHFIPCYDIMKVDKSTKKHEYKDILIAYISKKYIWDSA